ncbi:MAG: MFS transporter [Actinomycetia bacterium]|nr:MFS transporter [Actinomycetes bacterium]
MSTPEKITDGEAQIEAPKNLTLALIVICTAQLMVVLDATIVNIALPSIQDDLGFSQANLQWVLTAYTLAFGGFLLLGGRAGDILGRRRVFIFGIWLFSIGSLGGGFAWSEASLLFFRAVQGLGAAIAAPTALSLIATEFPEGKERNRAMGVYAAMSGAGAAVGLILGGILTEFDWRWVMFVNVPIGVFIALVARRALHETERHTGKFDLPGAITATSGLALLVYGLTRIATSIGENAAEGVSSPASDAWTDPTNLAIIAVSVVLLVVFVALEARSRHALMPLRIFENRNRAGAYGVMLIIGAAMFGMFFYLTQFVQEILDYSPIKAGFAFLPVSVCIIISAGAASQLITRFGAKPFAMLGTALTAVGMLWLAQIQPDSTYVGGLLGPMIVFALGLGFTFMPLTLAAVSQIDESDAGIASGVLNTTQQIGGSIGLAVLTTVSVTVYSTEFAKLLPAFLAAGGQPPAAGEDLPPELITAQVDGWTAAFQVSAGLAVIAFLITAFAIKVTKEEEAHAGPMGGAH